jgi:hypothetical protein
MAYEAIMSPLFVAALHRRMHGILSVRPQEPLDGIG